MPNSFRCWHTLLAYSRSSPTASISSSRHGYSILPRRLDRGRSTGADKICRDLKRDLAAPDALQSKFCETHACDGFRMVRFARAGIASAAHAATGRRLDLVTLQPQQMRIMLPLSSNPIKTE
jgi:hypothetical protein